MTRILIVEDNEEVSRMYERLFRLNGYEVSIAPDGAYALKVLRSSSELPAAIIMDVSMPNMNGYTLLQNIKNEETLKKIPIAVLTNSIIKEKSEEFYALGADLYLVKLDQSSKDIVSKVDKLIKEREFIK
ncbi:MAG: response regulator [Candidatus Paceibacterota bacterium]|jgi:CheY-like chemotaxis protein